MSSNAGFGLAPFGTSKFGGSERFGDAKKIIDMALRATGCDISDEDQRTLALDFLNMRYNQLLSGRNWKFLQKTRTIDLYPPYKTGTVKVEQGVDTVEENIDFSANPPTEPLTFDATMLGQTFIAKNSEGTSYEITEVINPKKLRISGRYSDSSAETTSFKILYDHYTIGAGVGKIRSALLGGSYGRNPELRLIGRQEMRQIQKRQSYQEGIPQFMCLNEYENDGSGNKEFFIWPAPDKRYSLQIDYDALITPLKDEEGCFPLIPDEYSNVLYFAVCADMYGNQNNATMVQKMGSDAALGFEKMAADYEMTDNKAKIMSKRNYYTRPTRRMTRHSSQRYAGLDYFGRID